MTFTSCVMNESVTRPRSFLHDWAVPLRANALNSRHWQQWTRSTKTWRKGERHTCLVNRAHTSAPSQRLAVGKLQHRLLSNTHTHTVCLLQRKRQLLTSHHSDEVWGRSSGSRPLLHLFCTPSKRPLRGWTADSEKERILVFRENNLLSTILFPFKNI